jgi:hypothetical protein
VPVSLVKGKLLAPKDGWLDKKGVNLQTYRDRHRLLQHVLDIFLKLRNMLRKQAEAAPTAQNKAKRSLGVKRAKLLDPEDYDDKMEDMSVFKTLELVMNELYEATCALYIRHQYNPAVVENFLGDKFFWRG